MQRTLLAPHKSLRLQNNVKALISRRYSTNKFADSDLSPEKRFISILIAFGVGCSIYFFLDDPRQPQKNETWSLSPRLFSPTRLTSSEESTSNTKLIEVTIPPNILPQGLDRFSPIWSVYVKDDDIQVERPYTPLRGISHDGRMQFWIKKYPHGEVSRWIHSKKVGDKLEIRGPLTTWPWKDDAWDEVVMVSPKIHFYCNIGKLRVDLRRERYYTLCAAFQHKNCQPPIDLEDSFYFVAFLSNAWRTASFGTFEPPDYFRQGTTRAI